MGPIIRIPNNDRHSSAVLGATSGAPTTIPLTTTSPSTTNTQSAYNNCLNCIREARNGDEGYAYARDYNTCLNLPCHRIGIMRFMCNSHVPCEFDRGRCRRRNNVIPEEICASLSTTMPPTTTAALASTSAAPTVRIISE